MIILTQMLLSLFCLISNINVNSQIKNYLNNKNMENNIVPLLWFDTQAIEAVNFYVSLFDNSIILNKSIIERSPSGNVDFVRFELSGVRFMAMSAGPFFKINESTSFFVYCGSDSVIENLFSKLADGGSVLMELGKYDWSPKYAWIKDKFGMSWQLDVNGVNTEQKIVPALLFNGSKALWVKEAVNYYSSVFPNSKILLESPYDKSAGLPDDALLFAQVKIFGYLFNMMSSKMNHGFDFNEAVSFMVQCNDQEEIDYYWDKLTEGGVEQPCGWLKDKFGVSWQIVPKEMDEMMATKDKDKLARVTDTFLKMKKLDLAKLRKAYNNE